MVRKTFTRRPRRVFRRRGGRKNTSKAMITKIVNSIMTRRLEHKYIDYDVDYFQLDSAGTVQDLIPSITQGSGVHQRVGDRISNLRLRLSFNSYFNQNIALANPQHTFRVIVFQWNEDSALSAPGVSSVIEIPSSGAGHYSPIDSPLQWTATHQKDMHVVYDRKFSVGVACQGVAKVLNLKFKRPLQFNAGAQTGTGRLYMMACADDITGAHTPDCQFRYTTRLTYLDG